MTLLIIPIALLAGLAAFQDRLILQPELALPSWRAAAAQSAGAMPWLEDGRYLGKIHEAQGMERGTVVLYHGNAGNVDHRAPLARTLSARGFRTVLMEYPGFGEREGRAAVSELLAASLDGFALARRRWPGPLYVVGESFGAGMAAQVAGRHPRDVAGVLLITPWSSLSTLANEKALHLPVGFLLAERLDSAEALAGYGGNLAIIGAGNDSVIPVAHARTLARAKPDALYLELPAAGHNNWLSRLSAQDWDRIVAAMTR